MTEVPKVPWDSALVIRQITLFGNPKIKDVTWLSEIGLIQWLARDASRCIALQACNGAGSAEGRKARVSSAS